MRDPAVLTPVQRAISVMRERYDEPLPLPHLASEALLSPFHFARIFRRETGVSPGRYLTAVRLYEAKRLLLTTDFTVADISCRVGYSSVGTFTTRFTGSVGISPNRYRQLPRDSVLAIADGWRTLPQALPDRADVEPDRPAGALAGCYRTPAGEVLSRVFVGVFDGPIPQRGPVRCSLLSGANAAAWRIEGVPPGSWTVVAMASRVGGDPASYLVGTSAPVEVRAGATTTVAGVLRRPRPSDPPILLTVHRAGAVPAGHAC